MTEGLLSERQHACFSNHSTATNLPERAHEWLVLITNCLTTYVVLIDSGHASDSIVFPKSQAKLYGLGIAGKQLARLDTFSST